MPTPSDISKPAAGYSSDAANADARLILIAEDDPFISRMYQIKLEGAGLRVIVKNNGRDAYEAIRSEHPNLAVLDINMPELSGLEVLAALQNDGFDFASMPVIVLTNSSELSDRNRAHSFGAEYLVKAELTPREVLNIINAKLGQDEPPPTMLEAFLAAAITFAGVFLGLRALEWLYHRLRRTPDWSPHWGSWVFAVLLAICVFVNYYGR